MCQVPILELTWLWWPWGWNGTPLGLRKCTRHGTGRPVGRRGRGRAPSCAPSPHSCKRAGPRTTACPVSSSAQGSFPTSLPSWLTVRVAEGNEATSTYERLCARRPHPATASSLSSRHRLDVGGDAPVDGHFETAGASVAADYDGSAGGPHEGVLLGVAERDGPDGEGLVHGHQLNGQEPEIRVRVLPGPQVVLVGVALRRLALTRTRHPERAILPGKSPSARSVTARNGSSPQSVGTTVISNR